MSDVLLNLCWLVNICSFWVSKGCNQWSNITWPVPGRGGSRDIGWISSDWQDHTGCNKDPVSEVSELLVSRKTAVSGCRPSVAARLQLLMFPAHLPGLNIWQQELQLAKAEIFKLSEPESIGQFQYGYPPKSMSQFSISVQIMDRQMGQVQHRYKVRYWINF